jgi:hypothetical protein
MVDPSSAQHSVQTPVKSLFCTIQDTQDGARVHTASLTTAYLMTMAIVIDNWPACSLDLNQIENLWPILKRRVQELQPITKDHLIDVWEHLKMGIVNTLVDSIPHRMILVIQKRGDRIPY